MFQAIIAAVFVAFLSGGGLGFYTTYRFYHIESLQAENSALKEGRKKTAEAVSFTEGQDEEADTIEAHNKEIVDAITKKVDDAKTLALRNVQCIDADSLRDIAKIQ